MTDKVNRDWFYKLASDLPEERLQSAVGLIKELSDLPLPDCNDEWSYVLNRLIKGLSSDRNSARLGFSLCLTEVINLAINLDHDKAPECLKDINMFLVLLSKTLNVDNNTDRKRKGKEERGSLFGKLFGLQTLLADPLFDSVFFDGKNISHFAMEFIGELIDLSMRKNWIKEPCLFTVYQTVERLITKQKDMKFVDNLISILDHNNLTLTNEGLSIYILLHKHDIHISPELSMKNKSWKSNDPLKKGNLPLLSDVLRDVSNASSDMDEGNKNSANWTPRLHNVWDILLPELINNNSSQPEISEPSPKKRKKNNGSTSNHAKTTYIQFPEFWQTVVDESFFNEKASSERKYLGFLIFIKTFPMINGKFVQNCFGQNLMRSIINQSMDSKRHLHKISQRVLNSIIKACETDSEDKLIPTVDALLFGSHGSINFDKLTKSKTISKLISIKEVSNKTLTLLIQLFASKIEKSDDDKKTHFILDTLLHIIRNHKSSLTENTQEVILPLLNGLVELSFFKNDKEPKKQATKTKSEDEDEDEDLEKTSQDLSEIAQERLYSILSELSIVPTGDSHSWQFYTLQDILRLEKSSPLKTQLDESLLEVKKSALEILNQIYEGQSNKSTSRGLEALLSMCLLQLYAGDVDSISTIEELCEFHKSKKADSLVGVTEILLSLLAQRKAVLTKTSLLVWEQFISEIGREELQVVLDVLLARENKQGFAQLFEGADEYEAVESGEEDGEGEDEDEEESEESDDSDLEDSDESTNEDALAIDRETTSALAKALNLPEDIVNENGEVKFDELSDFSGDDDDEEEEEESMDDEKMMELDDQLSQIFKRRKDALSNIPTGHKRKLEVRDSRETVIAFKQRMIDLLSIYIKYVEKLSDDASDKEEKLQNLIIFLEPMIKCTQMTLDRPLAEKISKLLKTRLFKIKISSVSDREEISALLKSIHEDYILTSKPGQHISVYYSLCSSISINLGKILVDSADEDRKTESLNQLIDLYGETTKQWMTKGKFTTSIFTDFLNWLSSKRQI